MSAVVVPSGECLRGDGRCADRIVNNFSAVVLAAYLPVLNLLSAALGLRAVVYIELSCVSAVVLRSLLYSNNKVENQVKKFLVYNTVQG